MRVLTWNMGGFTPGLNSLEARARSWELLAEATPDVALIQEASVPIGIQGQLVGPDDRIASRIWAPELELSELRVLDGVREHGWVSCATVGTDLGPIKLVSLHARTQGSAIAHVEALLGELERELAGSFVLAGDFNTARLAEEIWPGYRHLEFFETAEERYGLFNCFWLTHGIERRTYFPKCEESGSPCRTITSSFPPILPSAWTRLRLWHTSPTARPATTRRSARNSRFPECRTR